MTLNVPVCEGIQLPTKWIDHDNSGHQYFVYRHKLKSSDKEYKDVESAFKNTGGGGKIVSILRVQNPKIYKIYMQEREEIKKRRHKQLQAGTNAVLEIKGFHGTNSEAMDKIISNGFNRSYAGSSVGI